MRGLRNACALALVLGGLACEREKPYRMEDANLGVKATFPGEARLQKHAEDTPFGRMEWFDTAYYPPSRMDESFHIEVGNLPPGKEGGDTPQAVAETFRKDLERRLGKLQVTTLAGDRGPGFRYLAEGPQGTAVGGVLVVRRGRLHHAQAMVSKPGDPRLEAFLDSLEIAR